MDTSNSGYRLLELIALSGEFSPGLVVRLGISPSYSEKLITRLKEQKYIKTHYKDRLRGYRLTSSGKKLLLARNPDRFLFIYPAVLKRISREAVCPEGSAYNMPLMFTSSCRMRRLHFSETKSLCSSGNQLIMLPKCRFLFFIIPEKSRNLVRRQYR